MDQTDYTIEHFVLMTAIAGRVERLGMKIEKHEYLYNLFGSWISLISSDAGNFKLTYDGRDERLSVERENGDEIAYNEYAQNTLLLDRVEELLKKIPTSRIESFFRSIP